MRRNVMQFESRKALSLFVMIFLCLGIIIAGSSDSYCQFHTVIDSDITQDTVWDVAGSPYVVTREIRLLEKNVATDYPVTLRIKGDSNNPVIIKIAPNQNIYFEGIVEADNVIFTSLNEDFGFAYYDSTGDPQPGDWAGIQIGNIKSIFRGCTFRYGDYVECYGAAVKEFFNCDFEYLSSYGLLLNTSSTENCYPTIRTCDFINIGEPFTDTNGNGKLDAGESYIDYNNNGFHNNGVAIMMRSPAPYLTSASPTFQGINDIIMNNETGVNRSGYPIGLFGNAFPQFSNPFRQILQDANDPTITPSIYISGKIAASEENPIFYTLPVVTDLYSPDPVPYTIGYLTNQSTEATQWDFIIGTNVTLELTNLTTLKFLKGVNFRVDGIIKFPEGESNIVYFTSINDDSIGGKLVGSSGIPLAGDWGIFRINQDNTITNCLFSNGTEIFFNQLTQDSAFNNNSVVQFSNYDLHCYAASNPCTMEISQNLLTNGRVGIYCETEEPFSGPCSPKICENDIIGHSYYPIILEGTCNPDYNAPQCGENYVENENYPAIGIRGTIKPNHEIQWYKISDLSYVILNDFQISGGKDYNGVTTKVETNVLYDTNPRQFWITNSLIGGKLNPNTSISQEHLFEIISNTSTSVTVIVPTAEKGLNEFAKSIGGDTYSISLYPSKLQIWEDIVIKFDQGYNLSVNGILEPLGTPAHPVVFTSIFDDDFGKSIEPGHSEMASRGDWGSIFFYNSYGIIQNSIFRYGTSVLVDSCSPNFENNVFSEFSKAAIFCDARIAPANPNIINNQISCNRRGVEVNTTPTYGTDCQSNPKLYSNDFFKNTEYALYNHQSCRIDAAGNWWGDVTGPWSTECPDGLGDAIGGNVQACGPGEFLTDSIFSVDNEAPIIMNLNPPDGSLSASVATDISFDLIDRGSGLDLNTFSVQVDHGDGTRPIFVVKNGIIQDDPTSDLPYDVEILSIPDGIQFIYNPAKNFILFAKVCTIVYINDNAFCPNILGDDGEEFCFTPGVFQGLSDGRVDPKCGNADTEFYYSVSFNDGTANPPMSATLYIDNDAFNMTLETGDPASGTYAYRTYLDEGYHSFYFEFVTSTGITLRLPEASTETFPGPYVASDYDTIAWPMFRQNQMHNAHSYIAGPSETVTVDWSFAAGGDFLSSPVVDIDNNVYCASYDDGIIYKFNSTGEMVWSYDTGSNIQATPAIDRLGNLFVGAFDNFLYGFDSSGSLMGKFWTGGFIDQDKIISSPTIGPDDKINQSGNVFHMFNLEKNFDVNWWLAGSGKIESTSCIYIDGRTFFGCDDKYLYAGDSEGLDSFGNPVYGIPRWKYKTSGGIESSPAVDCDGNVYVGSNDQNIYSFSYDGTTDHQGILMWSYPTQGMVKSSPAIGWDGTIYVGSLDYSLYALRSDGILRWTYMTNGSIHSSPAIDGNENIYIGSDDGSLYCLDNNGGVNWIWDAPNGGAIHSSVAIGPDGRIYVGAGNTLYALKEGVNNAPRLSSGKVSSLVNNRLGNNFVYTVNYYDKDGDIPKDKYAVIDGIKFNMSLFNGYSSNGKYQFQTYLNSGVHDYYFIYTDAAGNTVRLPSNGSFSGPIVSLPASRTDEEFSATDSTSPVILMAGFANTNLTYEEGGVLTILALADDAEKDIKEIEVLFNGIPTGVMLKDDGTEGDRIANDSIYGFTTNVSSGVEKGLYLIELMARDYEGNISNIWPYVTVDLNTNKCPSITVDQNLVNRFYDLLSSESNSGKNVVLAGGFMDTLLDTNRGGNLNFYALTNTSNSGEQPLFVTQFSNFGLNDGKALFLMNEDNPEGLSNDEIKCFYFSSSLSNEISRGLYLFTVKDINSKDDILFPFLIVN